MRSRLGDDIDDFCVKCKRVMNHLVVSLLNDEPAKVRCRTCHGDHDFRHEQAPPPKVDARKVALLQQQALEKAAAAGSEISLDGAGAAATDAPVITDTIPLPALPDVVAIPAPVVEAEIRTAGRKSARAK